MRDLLELIVIAVLVMVTAAYCSTDGHLNRIVLDADQWRCTAYRTEQADKKAVPSASDYCINYRRG